MGDIGPLLWAKKFRMISVAGEFKPFSISRPPFVYPFLQEIYNSTMKPSFRELVVKKPTQVGLTELAINTAFYFLDTKGENVIYMLPSADQLGDFAHARLDRVIRESPHINNLFQDTDNVGLKVGKRSSLYLRGSNSESKLEEVPAGLLIRDEYTFMNADNAKKARNRLDASAHKWVLDISHPRFPGEGIDARYEDSTRQEWEVTCRSCGERQTLSFPGSVDMDEKKLVCRSCGAGIDPMDGGWSPGDPDNPVKGFHLSQLFSPTITVEEIVGEYRKAKSATDLRLFYNNRLGEAWTSSGRRLTRADVLEKVSGEEIGEYEGGSVVLGVDVGETELFYWVQAEQMVLEVGRVREFSGLEKLIERYGITVVVVDREPETRRARRWGEKVGETTDTDVWLCFRSDRLESEKVVHEDAREIKVNKTDQLDEFFYQFTDGDIVLPHGVADEVVRHLLAPKRVIEETNGRQKARWKKGTSDFADAGSYARLAQEILEERRTGPTWKTDWEEDERAAYGGRELLSGGKFKEYDPREVLLNERR
ncbi:MAG: terminase gpA endonuclease subunit [Candidatus Acetothermia bacterium]